MTLNSNTWQAGNYVVEYDDSRTGEHIRREYGVSDNAYEDYQYYLKQWYTRNVKYGEEW